MNERAFHRDLELIRQTLQRQAKLDEFDILNSEKRSSLRGELLPPMEKRLGRLRKELWPDELS